MTSDFCGGWAPDRPPTTGYVCDACKGHTAYEGDPPTECSHCGIAVIPPVAADPDRACSHEDFQSVVAVNRIAAEDGGPIIAYSVDVTVTCLGCGEPFRFTGLEAGVRPDRPTVDLSEVTLHAPVRPASADPDFGLGIPGFSIRYRGPGDTPDDGRRDYGPPQ